MRTLYGGFSKQISTPHTHYSTVSSFCTHDEEDSVQALVLGIQDVMEDSAIYHLRRRAITKTAGGEKETSDSETDPGDLSLSELSITTAVAVVPSEFEEFQAFRPSSTQ